MTPMIRRKSILVAAGMLFSEQGIAATTVRQIADEVGVFAGSLYHHFPSKESIASEILVDFLQELKREYLQLWGSTHPTRDRIAQLVVVSLRVAAQHPFATEMYLREITNLNVLPDHEAITRMVEGNHAMWTSIVEDGRAAGELRTDLTSDVVLRTMSELIWLTVRWNRASLAERHDELANRLVTILFEGVSVHPPGDGAEIRSR